MSVNSTILSDPSSLSQDELCSFYEELAATYKSLKEANEVNKQTIHKLKLDIQTALNGQAFLSSELESISSVHAKEFEEISRKGKKDIEDLKTANENLVKINSSLERETEKLKARINVMSQELECKQKEEPVSKQNKSMDYQEKLTVAESENVELTASINDLEMQLNDARKQIDHFQITVDDLNEKCSCLEENLQSKKQELEESNQLYDLLQERVFSLTDELATYKIDPNAATQRGNSLFAEVDDQRQKMKHQLAAQQKFVLQMKNDYKNSQNEIRRLKREQSVLRKELEICTTIFTSADCKYKQTLNAEIGQLIAENKALQKKLDLSQSQLIETAREHGITWLDSMLAYCKSETNTLKEQLSSCKIQKATTESILLETEQNLAKWRFEALKLRCMIVNRESLLEENDIPFDKVPAIDNELEKIKIEATSPDIQIDSTKIVINQNGPDHISENKENIDTFQENEDDVDKENSIFKVSSKNSRQILSTLSTQDDPKNKKDENDGKLPTLNSLHNKTPTRNSSVKVLTHYREIIVTPKDKAAIKQFNDSSLKNRTILMQPNPMKMPPVAQKSVSFSPIEQNPINNVSISETSAEPSASEMFKAKPNVIIKRVFVKSKKPA